MTLMRAVGLNQNNKFVNHKTKTMVRVRQVKYLVMMRERSLLQLIERTVTRGKLPSCTWKLRFATRPSTTPTSSRLHSTSLHKVHTTYCSGSEHWQTVRCKIIQCEFCMSAWVDKWHTIPCKNYSYITTTFNTISRPSLHLLTYHVMSTLCRNINGCSLHFRTFIH